MIHINKIVRLVISTGLRRVEGESFNFVLVYLSSNFIELVLRPVFPCLNVCFELIRLDTV